ncbi:MAG: outer membrane protein assembly factor BamA [Alphaproteobacteria bacterium]
MAALWAPPATAQDGETVKEVVIEGNKRIEPETVRTYMLIQEGDRFDPERVDRSLKSLFATGLFADVTLRRDGNRLLVKVVENPIINRIAFEGNKRIKEDALSQEIQLKPRVVYTRTKVQSDVQRIIDLYRRRGRFAATVEPKVIEREQNRVDLVFEINEGPSTYVRRVNFVGNKRYSEATLAEVIATREERWYRFFSSADTYDPDRLTFDRELLRRFYLKHGYADFRVASAVAELTPDKEGFYITFSIEEGERYRFGNISVEAALPDFKGQDLSKEITAEKDAWYNADEVEKSVQNLTERAGQLGYAFVDVRPRVNRDRQKHTVDIVFDIQEGPRVYVERIDITGNVRTLDKVIRREFRLVEGDAFNAAKLRRSRQRVEDLDFFDKAEISNVPSETAPDRTVVKIHVEEKSTGELSFGVGWSTTGGAMFEIGLRERNLLGRGQDLKTALSVGQRRNQLDFSFTEPYLFDRELAAGVDAFAIERNLQKESSYSVKTVGGAVRAGFSYVEPLRHSFNYTLKTDTVSNVKDGASTYIREQAGKATVSSVGHALIYDRRDSRVNPSEGHVVRLGNEYAGLGGTEEFVRSSIGGAYYYPVADQWVLKVSADGGHIVGLGKKVRINERYFLGGDNLRGFAAAGVGARDKESRDSLGGNWLASGSVEMSFPLGLPRELGMSGKLFSDFGTLGNPDKIDSTKVETSQKVRVSLGTGITWKSPMGPLSIDLALPLASEAFDQKEFFRFNFGTRF